MKPNLYHSLILDHAHNPHHFGCLEKRTHEAEGYNPQCGDHLQVYLLIDDHEMKEVSFDGHMCALCKASASMMTDLLLGKHVVSLQSWCDELSLLVQGEKQSSFDQANVFTLMQYYPARRKCVTLPWHAALAAVSNQSQASTEYPTKTQLG